MVASDAVLMALSTGQKTGLAVMGGCFILFALLSSFVLPRFRPNYPGSRGLRWFIVAVLVLTAGMLSTVVFLASESKSASEAAQKKNAVGNRPSVTPGSAAAGKALFTSSGCTACHTYAPAGSSATVGPNLDHLAADAQKANRGSVQQYATESIEDPGAYVAPGYPPGVMPTDFATTLGKSKIADLVAFLTEKS